MLESFFFAFDCITSMINTIKSKKSSFYSILVEHENIVWHSDSLPVRRNFLKKLILIKVSRRQKDTENSIEYL